MIKFLKLFDWNVFETIPEGVMAHEITTESIRAEILENYNKRYKPEMTPWSNPEKYDPFNPPKGWAYDPYYEIWIKNE